MDHQTTKKNLNKLPSSQNKDHHLLDGQKIPICSGSCKQLCRWCHQTLLNRVTKDHLDMLTWKFLWKKKRYLDLNRNLFLHKMKVFQRSNKRIAKTELFKKKKIRNSSMKTIWTLSVKKEMSRSDQSIPPANLPARLALKRKTNFQNQTSRTTKMMIFNTRNSPTTVKTVILDPNPQGKIRYAWLR